MKISLLLLLKPLFKAALKSSLRHKATLLFLSSFLCFFSAASSAQNIVSEGYQLSQIAPEPYTQVIKRSGKVNFKRTVKLSFKTAGFLTQLNVDEGDIFTEKQLLAALDTAELLAEKNATYARLLQAKRNVKPYWQKA